ncbi:MAG: formate dehydrogenase accessory sulfurtransferase FdhD [Candidatus Nezhaarchaeales archaeon]
MTKPSLSVRVNKLNVKLGSVKQEVFEVAVEAPVSLSVNGKYLRTLVATPIMLTELALGHLYSEGIIDSLSDVKDVIVKELSVDVHLFKDVNTKILAALTTRVTTTACGSAETSFLSLLDRIKKPIVLSSLTVDPNIIPKAVLKLNEVGVLYKATKATHSAVILSTDGNLVAVAEDVGRHNAVDKAIGLTLLKKVNLSGCILVCSGRPTADMTLKAARAGIPVVLSLSLPTDLSIKIAEETGVTLASVRGRDLTIYAHPERLLKSLIRKPYDLSTNRC